MRVRFEAEVPEGKVSEVIEALKALGDKYELTPSTVFVDGSGVQWTLGAGVPSDSGWW